MTDSLYKKLSADRKMLQEKDLIPEWYSTGALQMFQEKYEHDVNGRSVRGQFERIAKTAASYIKEEYPEAEEKFFNLLWQGWLSPSTPVLANTGTDRGMSVSCSGSTVDDSIDGFYDTLHETAMLTKNGFGTSAYIGGIRARGTKIAAGGKASGVLPVVKAYIQTMRDVAQGTQRRGAWAGYIEMDHGDFDELADHCMHEPDDMNIGWLVKDSFVAKCNAGDKEALRRFRKALKLKMVHGRGYFCFIDKVNASRPEAYVKHNLDVKASNLCVAPETLVLTDKGQIPIAQLENQEVQVWNGQEFSTTTVRKTGTNQKLITVCTTTGQELDCTPEHKFYVLIDYQRGYKTVKAADLKVGDKLIKFDLPTIEGTEHPLSQNEAEQCVKIADISDKGRFDDTYCFTEPARHMGMFNGILTGNCDEITLHADKDHTYTCVLSSMNVAKYEEWKDTDAVYWATIFLDCIAEDFIQKGKAVPKLEKAGYGERASARTRAMRLAYLATD